MLILTHSTNCVKRTFVVASARLFCTPFCVHSPAARGQLPPLFALYMEIATYRLVWLTAACLRTARFSAFWKPTTSDNKSENIRKVSKVAFVSPGFQLGDAHAYSN